MQNEQYWETRLTNNLSTLAGVGYSGFGQNFNKWMYKERKRIFKRVLNKLGLPFTELSVFEIASGTGFYTEILRELKVNKIIGSDITNAVVNKLGEEFSEMSFYKQDIGGELRDELKEQKFDLITAIDMMFHITDDPRYQKAFHNANYLLEKNGYFIFTENLPIFNKPGDVQTIRSKDKIFKFLEESNLEIVKVVPNTLFLNEPLVDNKFLRLVYKFQTKILYRYKSSSYKEKAGNFLGFIFYLLDWIILPFVKNGPSIHIIICKKK